MAGKTKERLRCVVCNRRANVVLHGTSYCSEHGVEGLNQESVKLTDRSPLERAAKRKQKAQATTVLARNPSYRPHPTPVGRDWTATSTWGGLVMPSNQVHKLRRAGLNRMQVRYATKSYPKKLEAKRRNARRRALQKRRLRAKVQAS